jgi:hypothetical protein
MLLAGALHAQDTPKFVPALGWDTAQQGAFPTCIAGDSQNTIWVGTEDKGLWRYDARAKTWTQFTTKNGLGDDDVYALAVDKLNRVWAGHLNHGVSVWNGEKWRNYGFLDGPLGDRVFAIATCPKDGDVWIATELGLARYSIANDNWDYFNRASGLPSNQIQCVAFDSNGNIYAGTQCDGIAMADAADNYKKWRVASGPPRMPNAGSGEGLPASLINDIMVGQDSGQNGEEVCAATPLGMCSFKISNKNPKWMFMRGADWNANVSGLYNAPAPIETSDDIKQQELLEDWVTCLRQDPENKGIWIGYRQKGLEERTINGGKVVVRADTEGSDSMLVRSIWLGRKTPPLIAIYDAERGGLKMLDNSTVTLEPGSEPPKSPAPLPSPAKAPDADSIVPLTQRLDVFKTDLKPGDSVYLGDDWRTQGDWVGRYGNSFAMLCGLDAGANTYTGEPGYNAQIDVGPHVRFGGLDAYVPNLDASNNPHVLYSPTLGIRKEAEFNDRTYNRSYPFDWEGPDLWLDIQVPEGTHCVSLYFYNNDPQTERFNKYRDYDVQVLPWIKHMEGENELPGVNKDAVLNSAPLSRARVTDFAGGVYKQFVVAGPAHYIIRVGRNRSFVTKLQGVFMDRLSGSQPDKNTPLPGFDKVDYNPPSLENFTPPQNKALLSAASDLWTKLDETFNKRGTIGLQLPLRIWTYRAAVADGAPEALLANWRWQIALWTPEDRKQFKDAMLRAYQSQSGGQNPLPPPPPPPAEPVTGPAPAN